MGLAWLVLSVAMAGAVLAGPPRIIKRSFSDAVFETHLRAAMYSPAEPTVTANLQVRLRTTTRCNTPSCAGGDAPAYALKVRCRATRSGRCVGTVAKGPLEAWPVDFETFFGPWVVRFELTFDTGAMCSFEGRDDLGYPQQGYLIASTGTYACRDASGGALDAGAFRMGMALPALGDWGGPLRPQRPNRH